MKDAFRIKYLNPLARIEQELQSKNQGQIELKRIKYKMKSINAFALSQPSFYPYLPNQKNVDSGSTLTSPKEPQNSSVKQLINPEKEQENENQQKKNSKEIVNNQQGAIDQQYAVSKDLQQSIIDRLGNQFFQQQQSRQYCLDCDCTFTKDSLHNCFYTFSSLKSVNNRFQQLLNLMKESKSEKFLFFAHHCHHLQDSNKIIGILELLRGTGRIQMSVFEQLLRKRLINICSKKLSFILQSEEED